MTKMIFDKENENRPYVAACAVITKLIKGKRHILLGKRKNVAGAGKYYLPGGHIHMGEKIKEALKREIWEECGIRILPEKCIWVEENFEISHHINMYYESVLVIKDTKPMNKEPDKCYGWDWYPIDRPPKPLWVSLGEFLEQYK